MSTTNLASVAFVGVHVDPARPNEITQDGGQIVIRDVSRPVGSKALLHATAREVVRSGLTPESGDKALPFPAMPDRAVLSLVDAGSVAALFTGWTERDVDRAFYDGSAPCRPTHLARAVVVSPTGCVASRSASGAWSPRGRGIQRAC